MSIRKPQKEYQHFICCVSFSVKYGLHHRPQKLPYCPKCGDDADVKPYVRQQKSWTLEEQAELLRLINKTACTYTEIGKKLGRTKKSITHQVKRLREMESCF